MTGHRLLLTEGQRSINKAVTLVFEGADTIPRLAVKMPRVSEAVPQLRREAAVLRALASLRPAGLQGVPEVVFLNERPGQVALSETVLTGQPIFTTLTAGNYHRLALRATDWLADLAGHPPSSARSTWWDRLVEPVLADFESSFGATLDPALLRETRDRLKHLPDLPLVCEQRDFSPWNVLLTNGGDLAVLDWESAELQGLPALDLIYFLTFLTFFLDGAMHSGRFQQSYRLALDPTSLTGSVQQECFERYFRRLVIGLGALHPLRLLTWLLHSRSEYQRFMADHAGRPDSQVLRSGLFVTLWEEELRHGT
jgi:Phosphotransferase enzyme family